MAQVQSPKKAMAQILPLKKRTADSEDLAFLPAALEIVETPASPIGRSIAYAIMALFALAVIWACVGKVDIVASAKGKIVPSGRSKMIQPFETGVVRAIAVHDGQVVKAGEKLIQLDSTMNDAELKHYQSDLIAAQLDVARLQAELSDGDGLANFKPPDDAPPPTLIAMQRKFLARSDQLSSSISLRCWIANISRKRLSTRRSKRQLANWRHRCRYCRSVWICAKRFSITSTGSTEQYI